VCVTELCALNEALSALHATLFDALRPVVTLRFRTLVRVSAIAITAPPGLGPSGASEARQILLVNVLTTVGRRSEDFCQRDWC